MEGCDAHVGIWGATASEMLAEHASQDVIVIHLPNHPQARPDSRCAKPRSSKSGQQKALSSDLGTRGRTDLPWFHPRFAPARWLPLEVAALARSMPDNGGVRSHLHDARRAHSKAVQIGWYICASRPVCGSQPVTTDLCRGKCNACPACRMLTMHSTD